ncbi:hypothetical protein HDU76_003947 [Blyttiomyces sp. JEL0837]|nr:hypothetical protein HDU76_003947 [Blyttiomyces sp. JEL0837]
MNVDGYQYSFFRSHGVDLNRNWPAQWGKGGSSSSPTSDGYMGPFAGSEPEVQALMGFFMNENHTRLLGAIDFHAFSQLILRPYGYSTEDAPDEALLKEAGDGIRDIIKSVSGKQYTSEKSIDLYVTTGTASDWFYDEDVFKFLPDRRLYAYTIELRPSASDIWWGGDGFILPADQIIPTGEEILEAMKFYMEFALENPLYIKDK